MRILVTAFSPFDGRPDNASSLALRGLKREFPWINTRVLPVDSLLGPARMVRALRQLRPDAVVMLGEAAGSKTLRLERIARNELDFSIPDAAGRQPRATAIHPDGPSFLRSTLPCESIRAALEAAGPPGSGWRGNRGNLRRATRPTAGRCICRWPGCVSDSLHGPAGRAQGAAGRARQWHPPRSGWFCDPP